VILARKIIVRARLDQSVVSSGISRVDQLKDGNAFVSDTDNTFVHMRSHRICAMHKYAIGIPSLPISTRIDHCSICLKVKLHKPNKSTSCTHKATQCYQGISIDFGFVVQSSKDSERVLPISGLYSETRYVLLRHHFSNTLCGTTVHRHSGLHGETCYVLLRGHFMEALFHGAYSYTTSWCLVYQ
jgi:hypothetical protein